MFKIRNKIGNIFAGLVMIAFALFIYGAYPKSPEKAKGYTDDQRHQLTAAFANAEMEGGGIPRLSIADLDKKVGKDGWK